MQEANDYMGWITIYIQGKSGCSSEVLRNLEHSGVRFMPGSAYGEKNTALYWIDEKLSLRDFKKAIGSKTVFKYRLRFYTSLEKNSEFQTDLVDGNGLTPQEESLIREMASWEESQHRYKHSA
jgi:hypothetical protein